MISIVEPYKAARVLDDSGAPIAWVRVFESIVFGILHHLRANLGDQYGGLAEADVVHWTKEVDFVPTSLKVFPEGNPLALQCEIVGMRLLPLLYGHKIDVLLLYSLEPVLRDKIDSALCSQTFQTFTAYHNKLVEP